MLKATKRLEGSVGRYARIIIQVRRQLPQCVDLNFCGLIGYFKEICEKQVRNIVDELQFTSITAAKLNDSINHGGIIYQFAWNHAQCRNNLEMHFRGDLILSLRR